MRLAALALSFLAACGALAANAKLPRPRPLSDAERAAVAVMTRFVAGGPEQVWNELSPASPLRSSGKPAALREIEARLGPHDAVTVRLQTVVPSLRDRMAAFGVSFPSGADDAIVLEMSRSGDRWSVNTIRTSAEPSRPAVALLPRQRGDAARQRLAAAVDVRTGVAAALPAMLLALIAIGMRRARRGLSLLLGTAAAMGAVAAAAIVVIGALPGAAARGEEPGSQVPSSVGLAQALPVRLAVARGNVEEARAALAKLPEGDARDVATLWKVQLDLLEGRHASVARQIAPLRWRAETPMAHLLRARAAFLGNRVSDTVLAYEAAIGTGAGRDALWIEVAQTLSLLGFDERAAGYLQRAAETGSREPLVYYAGAMLSALDSDLPRAEKLFLAGWKMQPLPKGDALSMALLWEVFRQPSVTDVLRLQVPEEARFGSPSRVPIAIPDGTTAEVVGDYLLIRAGESELHVPGGASIAPAGTPIADAAAWQRREEEEALADFERVRERAAGSAALADPQLRERLTVTASTLAEKNRWQDVLSLTESLSARDERVPVELMLLRGMALSRAGRDADLRRLIVDLLRNPAVRRRREPVALVAVAELLAAVDNWDAAIAMLSRARKVMDLPGLEERIQQLLIEKNLSQVYQVVKSEHFDIHYPPIVTKEFAERTGEILELELKRLRREWLPGRDLRRTRVNLLWWEDFRDYTGSDFVVGLYTDEIFLPTAGIPAFFPEIVAIMTHELMHAILAGDTNDLAPRWFHEAFASRVEMQEVTHNAFQRYADNRWLSIALLDDVANNSPDPELVGSAYSIGESTLRFVESRWGRGALRRLVQEFAAGKTTEEAVLAATGVPVAELDRMARAWGAAQPALFDGTVLRYDGYEETRRGTVSQMGLRR